MDSIRWSFTTIAILCFIFDISLLSKYSMSNLPEKKWVVYLIQTTSGKIYTGITNNLERRFAAHQKQNKGARFFRISSPEKVVKIECFANRSEATKREIAIKKMSRSEKLQLIASVQ